MKRYIKEELEEAVLKSFSWANVAKLMNKSITGGSITHLKKAAIRFKINYEHFTGQGWRKNKEFPNKKRDIQDYLSNKFRINSDKLRKRLIKEKIKENKCEICGLNKWNGEDIPLELDHINSNHNDNRIENLQILCPNCHSIETIKRRRKSKPIKVKKERKKSLYTPKRKVINRPTIEELQSDVSIIGYRATGRKYGVSDNCIRKWIKSGIAGMKTEQP